MSDGPTYLTIMSPTQQTQASDAKSPAFISESCKRMSERSKICLDLFEGFDAIKRNMSVYMPQYINEADEDYLLRQTFASLRNYYAQAVGSILGKMFAQPPALKDDVPDVIQKDLENADLNGNHWTISAKELMQHAINEGISWLMVDYHQVDDAKIGELSLADEAKLGLRPYWVVVPQCRVLGVRHSYQAGIRVITQFRFMEWVQEDSEEFGETLSQVIRVVEPTMVRTYRLNENSEWSLHKVSSNTLGSVCAIPLILDKVAMFEAKPPMLNLAYMNKEHFQIRSDQRRALSVMSFPMLFSKGSDAKNGVVQIGPMTSINFEDPGSDLKWVESNGNHLRAGSDELAKLESDMRTFGLAFENPQMYATATGRNIDASDAIAPIQFWALQLKDVLEIALTIHAMWRKLPSGGSVDVNLSFLKNMITVEGLKLLLEALKEGALSPEGFLNRMKDYGLLADDFDADSDVKKALAVAKERLKQEAALAPKLAPVAAPPKENTNA